MFEQDVLDEGWEDANEPVTTPGDMRWVKCDHSKTTKNAKGVCEACLGSGRVLLLVSKAANRALS